MPTLLYQIILCAKMYNFVCFGDQSTNAKIDIHLILYHFGLKLVGKNMLQTDCDIKSYDKLICFFPYHSWKEAANTYQRTWLWL